MIVSNSPDYTYMTPDLQKINANCVRLEENERRCSILILDYTLEILMNVMKLIDLEFAKMEPRLDLVGSFNEGLKITKPNEFDVNIVLKLPLSKKQKKNITLKSTIPGSTAIVLPVKIPFISAEDRRVSAKVIKNWMKILIEEALDILDNKTEWSTIERSSCKGNAYTFKISSPYLNDSISVDLVPALQMPSKIILNNSTDVFEKVLSVPYCFLTPHPSKDEFNWRINFPKQEKLLFKGKNHLKTILKLIKLLRDTQGWKSLTSYYIKTIFLWENEKQDHVFWENNCMGNILMYMLNVLKANLESGKIHNYWYPNLNLLNAKNNYCKIVDKLSEIIYNIERYGKTESHILLQYFTGSHKNII